MGLADTTCWAEYSASCGVAVPEAADGKDPVVTFLDPAAGTGTFLKQAILEIHRTLVERWRAEGKTAGEIAALWNGYVVESLAKRLHGLEVMVAPYAICHLKLALTLRQTGFTGPLPTLDVRL